MYHEYSQLDTVAKDTTKLNQFWDLKELHENGINGDNITKRLQMLS